MEFRRTSVLLIAILTAACATGTQRTAFSLVPLVAKSAAPASATVRVGATSYRVPSVCLCARLASGDSEGRLAGGDAEGRLAGGDVERRLAGGDAEARLSGGNAEGRLAGGDAEARLSGGDAEGRLAGGDAEARLSGGDAAVPMCRTNNDLCGVIVLADGTSLRLD